MRVNFWEAFSHLETEFNSLRPLASNPKVDLKRVMILTNAMAVLANLALEQKAPEHIRIRAGVLANTIAVETRAWLETQTHTAVGS